MSCFREGTTSLPPVLKFEASGVYSRWKNYYRNDSCVGTTHLAEINRDSHRSGLSD